jgi:Type II secretory pathway, component PulD
MYAQESISNVMPKKSLADFVQPSEEPLELFSLAAEETEYTVPTIKPPLIVDEDAQKTYLTEFLKPWEFGDPDEKIEFLFENTELSALLEYIEKRFNVTFIMDDAIKPLPQGGKSILGTKISFRTHEPLSKKQAWDLFVSFLDMAGLAPVPGPAQNIFKIISSNDPKAPNTASRGPLPTFIGSDLSLLPDNDTRVRYVYFVENTSLDVVKNVIDSIKSVSSPNLIVFPDLRAIIITDKASNIRSILAIIKELDQTNLPESLAIIKLQRADALKAVELYNALSKKDDQSLASRLLGQRKQSTMNYFSETTRVIAEPRTNSLILLGSKDSIARISDFVINVLDKKAEQPHSPLYVYPLRFTEAETIATILTSATQFQKETDAAKYGGVRDGDKFFKPISIIPEKTGNRLIINADYEDYEKIYDILQKIDVEQPQVALKVLIINVDLTDNKSLGVQIRDKFPQLTDNSEGIGSLIGKNTNFQTSNLGLIQENTTPGSTGATRLLGDLVNLASGVGFGQTLVSLGTDQYGVWGLLKILQTYTKLTVVANPFLVTTNKYQATVSVGETRRVISSQVFSGSTPTNTFDNLPATLDVTITPQISKDGLLTLDVIVNLEQFTSADVENGDRTKKKIQTSVIVADNEVLALGGLITETNTEVMSKVPVLGDIPLLGWLFKNKTVNVARSSLLILIAPEIIQTAKSANAQRFTESKFTDAKNTLHDLRSTTENRDPIHRWFFKGYDSYEDKVIEDFESLENRYVEKDKQVSPPVKKGKKQSLVEQVAETVPTLDTEGV